MDAGKIRYAQNGDVSIAYRAFGSGERDLIFVTGFVGHLEIGLEARMARRFFERLGSFSRVIVFDKRGFGLSDRSVDGYTVEAVAEDMAAILDHAGVERAAVFGVSEGGTAAAMFAATYPDRTTALVEFGTYARATQAPDYPEGIPVEVIREWQRFLLEGWGTSSSLPAFVSPEEARDPELREWWARLLRGGASPATVRGMTESYEHLDVRSVLPLIKAPTLILWRKGDPLIPPRLSKAFVESIPDVRGVELEGTSHLFMAGDQDALLGEVQQFLTGARRPRVSERVLATVLFTDIVGSTEQASALGDSRWRELLSDHNRLAGAEVSSERGRLVKSTGDGILATFDGPARAISAAQSLRDRLAPLGLRIRAGVHTGECEQLGDDLGGIAVHIGARVSSEAGPGEVLVSQTVRDLVVGSGLEFEDRGARELKGVPGEWRLFAVSDGNGSAQ
jgi:pimeloyl-ACP methyl ester carboxylesterase